MLLQADNAKANIRLLCTEHPDGDNCLVLYSDFVAMVSVYKLYGVHNLSCDTLQLNVSTTNGVCNVTTADQCPDGCTNVSYQSLIKCLVIVLLFSYTYIL